MEADLGFLMEYNPEGAIIQYQLIGIGVSLRF
jgi:hypothetical protein